MENDIQAQAEELRELKTRLEHVVDRDIREVDETARVRDQITLVVQVNGKLRGRIELAPGSDEDAAMAAAMSGQNVTRHTEGKDIRKVIYIPDRLLNIVVG